MTFPFTFGTTPAPLCGEPTKKGTPCKSHHYGMSPRCRVHSSTEEIKEADRLAAEREAAWTAHITPYPACWSWPVSDAARDLVAVDGWEAMYMWQDHRCATCGHSLRTGVTDHDHVTGWIRGFLCQSCNLREGHADPRDGHPVSRRLLRYRRWNPARILNVWEQYDHPLWGDQRQPIALPAS